MSFLAWLFGLGALSIAFPFLFHLIRRTPKGQQQFSSLMFLKPSPPRLTKRSRLENLLLLFLRMAAIAMIALAFMRPYLFTSAKQTTSELPGRRVAILIDSSASMKRGDLWQQAVSKAAEVTADLEENDLVSISTFDDSITEVLSAGQPGVDKAESNLDVPRLLSEYGPTWGGSDLSSALMSACDQLLVQDDVKEARSKLQIVVITDLQAGASVNQLGSYEWPPEVFVKFEPVSLESESSNAAIRIMTGDADSGEDAIRVHVRNADDSTSEQFTISNDAAAIPT